MLTQAEWYWCSPKTKAPCDNFSHNYFSMVSLVQPNTLNTSIQKCERTHKCTIFKMLSIECKFKLIPELKLFAHKCSNDPELSKDCNAVENILKWLESSPVRVVQHFPIGQGLLSHGAVYFHAAFLVHIALSFAWKCLPCSLLRWCEILNLLLHLKVSDNLALRK